MWASSLVFVAPLTVSALAAAGYGHAPASCSGVLDFVEHIALRDPAWAIPDVPTKLNGPSGADGASRKKHHSMEQNRMNMSTKTNLKKHQKRLLRLGVIHPSSLQHLACTTTPIHCYHTYRCGSRDLVKSLFWLPSSAF